MRKDNTPETPNVNEYALGELKVTELFIVTGRDELQARTPYGKRSGYNFWGLALLPPSETRSLLMFLLLHTQG